MSSARALKILYWMAVVAGFGGLIVLVRSFKSRDESRVEGAGRSRGRSAVGRAWSATPTVSCLPGSGVWGGGPAPGRPRRRRTILADVPRVLAKLLYWLAVLLISLALVVVLILFFESRDGSSLNGSLIPAGPMALHGG